MTRPVDDIAADFQGAWPTFVSDVGRVVQARLNRRGGAHAQHLAPVVDEVVHELMTEAALRDALSAFIQRARLHPETADYLLREAHFYHALTTPSAQAIPNTDAAELDAVSAGKTIKDSFEKYLAKLPSRWKRFLEVLNELLSIAKGG